MAKPRPANEAMTRRSWTDAALTALADGGLPAVKVETLAASMGVTKGSFYWHFADRPDLLAAMLERWEELATTRIIDQIDPADAADSADRLQQLAHLVFQADPIAATIETAIRGWAATDEVAAQTVRRVDDRRLSYVAGLLRPLGLTPVSARRRARLLYRTMIGEFLWRTSGGPTMTAADLSDLVDLLVRVKPSGEHR